MAKITINVNQKFDRCGDEFLNERNFEMTFDFDANEKFAVCVIDGISNCYIKKSDLLALNNVLLNSYIKLNQKNT